ncbi:hypothetical protein HI113_44255, partial [Corallococcus exiguus]|uniref:hypothetical protein n=1 Tax=Corallococcus exiguus TaxID=83462 RepID=UPI001848D132
IVTLDTSELSAFGPTQVEIHLKDGRVFRDAVDVALGHPSNALSEERHIEKFRANCKAGFSALEPGAVEGLIDIIADLEALPDMRGLMDLAAAPGM